MKKLNPILCAILLIAAGIIGGCIDDNSTMATGKVDGVKIDTTGMGTLSVLQFTNLEVKPNIKTNLSETNLSYEWKLNTSPSDTLYEVLSHAKNLNATIKRKSNSGRDPYQLLYTVTDKTTGLDYIIAWPLNVKNSLGEGLVVANNSGNGANTDLGLILSPQVTPDYTNVKVTPNAYSAINNDLIEGSVTDIQYTTIFGVPSLLMITDNSIVRVKRQDFTYVGKNDDLFFAHVGSYNSQTLGVVNQNGTFNVYIGNNQLTGAGTVQKKFTAPLDNNFQVATQTAINEEPTANKVLSFYDETGGYFVSLGTLFAFGDNTLKVPDSVPDGPFDPANIPNKENLAANAASNGDFRYLLRDKNSGDIHLYLLDDSDSPKPIAKYDFSNAPDIQNATHFVLPDNQKVMYYSTDTEIYAAIYASSSPVFEERYNAPAGESITTLQLYHQTGYTGRSPLLDTDGRQLIMSTYDGSEGQVYLLPIINLGVGNIDEANIKTYGGFGKVTAIAPQQ